MAVCMRLIFTLQALASGRANWVRTGRVTAPGFQPQFMGIPLSMLYVLPVDILLVLMLVMFILKAFVIFTAVLFRDYSY